MRKRALSAVLAISLVLTLKGTAFADPAGLQKSQSALKSTQDKRQSLEDDIQKMDNQVQVLTNKIDDNNKNIEKTKKDIAATQKDLDKSEEDIQAEQDIFNKRVRAMYISGSDSYIYVILEAKGLGDLVSRVENVKKVIDFDKNIIKDLDNKKKGIEDKKKALDAENDNLLAIKSDNEKKLAQINSEKDAIVKKANEYKNEEKKYSSQISAFQAEAAKYVSGITASVPKYQPSRGAASISSNSVVAYAANFIGTPYVWGGTSPRPGFDCSGFVQYVYGHFGVSLDRSTYEQIHDGAEVPLNSIQPGDLVFFGSYDSPHHVGIYVGNGMYIHAPQTGDSVKISPLSRSDFSRARRVR
ncbi:C40 family peptidase [Clostridium sp. JN-9]|uniref:C40 family peptidase n=1 Tax=Clostridium sp. JN-9 TaxID=2507159 RepID=UPI000FFE04D6|nr:C40 family peptidase [Clostridium sp. JN-9]QAT38867.1 glycoside hydrolase [Clostridium sp. JN-9]